MISNNAWEAEFARHGENVLSREPDVWVEANLDRLPGGRVFDAGAGLGRHTDLLQTKCKAVTAIDSSSVAATYLRERLDDRVAVVQGPIEEWAPDSLHDGGLCIDVLSVVKSPASTLLALRRATRSGGILLLTANADEDPLFSDSNPGVDGCKTVRVGGLQYRGFERASFRSLVESSGWRVNNSITRSFVDEPHSHRPEIHEHVVHCLVAESC